MAGPLDPKPVPLPPADNLWSFTYKIGPAPKQGVVRGKDEDEGYRVACHWCHLQDLRAPHKVFPLILAGPEILKVKDLNGPAEQSPLRAPMPEALVR